MSAYIVVNLRVEGFHRWPAAPDDVNFLRVRHRHLFHIRVMKSVTHGDRDIEIIKFKREVEDRLASKYGVTCEFGTMSCEHIAEWLLNEFKAVSVEVLEDGENGGLVTV